MSKRYIIRNCPAYSLEPSKYGNVCKIWCSNKPCQKHSDCLLKQIVEKCKEVKCPCEHKEDGCHYECDIPTIYVFAQEILDLLQIQEVE